MQLALTDDETWRRGSGCAGWQPELWAADEAARVLLLIASHHGDDPAFADRVDRLCTTAEVTEYIAYLKGFAIFPGGAAALRAGTRGRALVDHARSSRQSRATTPIRSTTSTRTPGTR